MHILLCLRFSCAVLCILATQLDLIKSDQSNDGKSGLPVYMWDVILLSILAAGLPGRVYVAMATQLFSYVSSIQ